MTPERLAEIRERADRHPYGFFIEKELIGYIDSLTAEIATLKAHNNDLHTQLENADKEMTELQTKLAALVTAGEELGLFGDVVLVRYQDTLNHELPKDLTNKGLVDAIMAFNRRWTTLSAAVEQAKGEPTPQSHWYHVRQHALELLDLCDKNERKETR